MKCDTCQQLRVVTLQHTLRLGRRAVTWRICWPCEREERRVADVRLLGAIAQAEAAGV